MEEYVVRLPDNMSTEARKRLTSLVCLCEELVRCKDCKYSELGLYDDTVFCMNDAGSLKGCHRIKNWFCADGKRKNS